MNKVFVLLEQKESGPDKGVYEYLFKTKRLREAFYQRCLMCDFSEHYMNWLSVHKYAIGKRSWKRYLKEVRPEDDYLCYEIELLGKDDPRAKYVYSDKTFESEMISFQISEDEAEDD